MKISIPLSMLAEGEEGKIVSIMGGHGLTRRLAELGFNLDMKVKVLRASSGPIVVLVRDCRIAIGRGVAMKIFLEVEK